MAYDEAWAVLWRTKNALDGERESFLCSPTLPQRVRLFETRREARAYIAANWSYLRERPDLRAEPHGWRMPIPVRVKVTICQ
jgi:hypothetical protein